MNNYGVKIWCKPMWHEPDQKELFCTDETVNRDIEQHMAKYRQAAKVDDNQSEIIAVLEKIPGLSIETGHDDILLGYAGLTFWFEIKNDKRATNKNGEIRKGEIRASQKKLLEKWKGHYDICSSVETIIDSINVKLIQLNLTHKLIRIQ